MISPAQPLEALPQRLPRERPILFSAPMVLAIRAGRKTVTRRIVTVPWKGSRRVHPYEPWWSDEDGKLLACDEYGDYHPAERCLSGYGEPGDRLWVRETFAPSYFDDGRPGYRADWTARAADVCPEPKWKPSIFMRRHESRILLEVESCRIERLHAISEQDAIAEGIDEVGFPRETFEKLWDKINGDRAPWADNPWVWRVAFRVIEKGDR